MAIAAVASFVTIRHSAKQAASEVAEETTGRLIEPKLIDYMSKNGVTLLAMTLQQRPEMLFEAAGRALELRSMMGGVTVQEASDIAEGIEEEDGNA
ncbi:MAG: hypothetical protein H7Y60_00980 [Rhodospirillaceae bacterium]|nr:hypothetical protein [Rhodospirillales bacterium]